MDSRSLIHRYLLGEATEAQVQELDRLMAEDKGLRREYVQAAATETGLREVAFERAAEPVSIPSSKAKSSQASMLLWVGVLASIAALLVFAVVSVSVLDNPDPVATLASGENAAWESSLPTTPGSKLTPGVMKLISGIATIRFDSGAEVVLEAPAQLMLISRMRGKLIDGAAMVSVPEPAVGFVLETPSGYVVDHGTRFAVNVAGDGKASDFEVIEGEISVHLSSTGEEVRLTNQQSASIVKEKLVTFAGNIPERTLDQSNQVIRIGSGGRATSVVRNNNRGKRLHPDMLMVKRTETGTQDRRSFFSFDLSEVDWNQVTTARLRLNLIPSGIGFANRLPKSNRFGVYGLTNEAKRNWSMDSLWADAPAPEDGLLLGTFEIPRSRQQGVFGIEGDELLNFLKTQGDEPVTLILVRETGQVEGEGPGLVHAFASDSHPESSGPVLEFGIK